MYTLNITTQESKTKNEFESKVGISAKFKPLQ